MIIRKKYFIGVAISMLPGLYVVSQNIPPSRITDWSSPGSGIPFHVQHSVTLKDFGADTSGLTASDHALQEAINALNGPGEIFVSKGTYLFEQTIVLPDSILLRGETDPLTTVPLALLVLSPGNGMHGIAVSGTEVSAQYSISYPLIQGQRKLYVNQAQLFSEGDFIRLAAFDDSVLVNDVWAYHTTGQILQIVRIEGDSLVLNKPLRRSYDADRSPVLYKLLPRRQVHISCLGIERSDTTTSQSSNIYLSSAVDCSIRGIQSRYCNYAHVDITNSTRITIENSFFKDAFSYGTGGKAYGVMLQSTSGDCFVHQNCFEHLRHSIILQSGASGNVLAYNYSLEPFWTGTVLPSNSAGDLVLHGNYPYMNLFEGNIVQNIVIDNSHGINGPFNMFYRNRAELYGLFMNTSPASDAQNFIGNQVTNTTSLFLGLYILQGVNHFEYGNIIKGIVQPMGTHEPNDSTMFEYDFGTFYSYISSIPPINLSTWHTQGPLIEAYYRYHISDIKGTCLDINYMPASDIQPDGTVGGRFEAYPNPFSHELTITNYPEQRRSRIRIFNTNGRLVYSGELREGSCRINTEDWIPGIYFVCIDGQMSGAYRMLKI